MENWTFEFKELPLKVDWKISRNSSSSKTNLFIHYKGQHKEQYKEQHREFLGEAAPNIRYQETPEGLIQEVELFKQLINPSPTIEFAYQIIFQNDFSNCFRFAISSIYHRHKASQNSQTLSEYFNLPVPHHVKTSHSLPILKMNEVRDYFNQHHLEQFHTLKLKIKDHSHIEQLLELNRIFNGRVIIDANEGFDNFTDWTQFLDLIKNVQNIELIEQPFPAKNIDLYKMAYPNSPYPIFLDESITHQVAFDDLMQYCHGVNIKLMKAGDPIIAIKQLQMAKALGLKTMIGCMIESSFSIEIAYYLTYLCDYIDLDGFLFLKDDPGLRFNMDKDILIPTNKL